MKEFIIVSLMFLLMTGCGKETESESKSISDQLKSTGWIFWDNRIGCGLAIHFNDQGKYATQNLCETGSNSANVQVTSGEYQIIEDKTLSLTPKKSSCATRQPVSYSFSLEGDEFTITMDATTLIMKRIKESTGSDNGLSFTTGCFEADGSFTARAVVDL